MFRSKSKFTFKFKFNSSFSLSLSSSSSLRYSSKNLGKEKCALGKKNVIWRKKIFDKKHHNGCSLTNGVGTAFFFRGYQMLAFFPMVEKKAKKSNTWKFSNYSLFLSDILVNFSIQNRIASSILPWPTAFLPDTYTSWKWYIMLNLVKT